MLFCFRIACLCLQMAIKLELCNYSPQTKHQQHSHTSHKYIISTDYIFQMKHPETHRSWTLKKLISTQSLLGPVDHQIKAFILLTTTRTKTIWGHNLARQIPLFSLPRASIIIVEWVAICCPISLYWKHNRHNIWPAVVSSNWMCRACIIPGNTQ